MKNNLLLVCGTALALVAATASAQENTVVTTRGTVLEVPAQSTTPTPQVLPNRSMNKAAVRRKYGEPTRSFPAVGDPPITRWDYPGFRVFFEYDLVLHSVVPGDFPRISNRDQLTPAR